VLLTQIKKQIQHQEIALAMFLLALCVYKFPLQHYVTMARFQHYGICLYIWALGFVLQTVWSWKYLTARGRACLISTAFYVGVFAIIFYQSPWLDIRMAVQTEENEMMRMMYAALCAFLGFIVCIFWLAWVLERNATQKGSTP
jgi:hypothetical protein